MITHQRQPSVNSCGPTCVAMLIGVNVEELIPILPGVRIGKRQRIRTHSSNFAELSRLLAPHGLKLYRRIKGLPDGGLALLRIQHSRGRNWHWCVFNDGVIHDGTLDAGQQASRYLANLNIDESRVSFYPVER